MKTFTRSAAAFLVLGVAALVAIGIFSRAERISPYKPKPALPMPPLVERTRQNQQLVEKYKNDPDPKAQDLVGQAQMRLAYFDAGKHDFAASREKFLQATKIKGTGAMAADFGGINDQAAYQAIVCLIPQHKEEQAKTEFRAFMKDRPLSPLVHGAFKRLVRLNKGKALPQDERLLQAAVTAQEKHIAYETSVCGPKTVEYLIKENLIHPLAHLARNGRGGQGGEGNSQPSTKEATSPAKAAALSITGKPFGASALDLNTQHQTPITAFPNAERRTPNAPNTATSQYRNTAAKLDYKSLATLFATTDKGTTMMAMRKGLRSLGIQTYGLKVNRRDFAKLPTPAIMLSGDHYLALLQIHERKALVFDSRYGGTQTVPLPALDTPEFSATVLTFKPIDPIEATN